MRRLVRSCIQCRKCFGKPNTQLTADLPQERITPNKPAFSYVGVVVFGPFLVKLNRSEIKRYGCLFTCLVTRAVHIEMLYSLETDTFINAFRRFVARRGLPETVFSDNGTNFVGANEELKRSIAELSHREISLYASRRNVYWKFIPSYASHMGGAWEHLIGSLNA